MPPDNHDDGPEAEVAEARSGVQAFSPSAFHRQRIRRGLTLRQLSLLSGVSAASISNWESGKVGPNPRLLAAVVAELDVDIADVVRVRQDRTRLVDLRHRAGLSQQVAADAAGMKRTTYGAIETTGQAPSDQQRQAFCHLYGLDSDAFDSIWAYTHQAAKRLLRSRSKPV